LNYSNTVNPIVSSDQNNHITVTRLCVYSCAWYGCKQFDFNWQPDQWTGKAEHGLAKEDVDQKD
jgi:hypothetical protein